MLINSPAAAIPAKKAQSRVVADSTAVPPYESVAVFVVRTAESDTVLGQLEGGLVLRQDN